MNALAQKTEWDDESTRVFLKYGQAFVPYRETQYGIICRILSQVRPRRVVELCCGQGKLSGLLLETLPEINLQAFDGSELMLESARKSLAGSAGAFKPCTSISMPKTGENSPLRWMLLFLRWRCIISQRRRRVSSTGTCLVRYLPAASSSTPI